MDIFYITIPIFSLIALGWGGVRLNLFDAGVGAGLSRFVFWLAFPALLLTSMAKAPAPDGAMAAQIGIWLCVLLAFQVLGRIGALGLGLGREAQAGAAMASSCGNTAFLGTAILTSLMGPDILPFAAAFVAVENIVVVSFGVAGLMLAKNADTKPLAMGKKIFTGLFNPTSVGALIGFIISINGLTLPAGLLRPLDMLGAAASPCGLVALGIVMATTPARITNEWQGTALVVVLKCIALPLATWFAFSSAGAPPMIIAAATVLAACPSAVNVFIQARQADVWAAQAATVVFVTTLVSVLGVSVAASLWP